ncbi:MAG: glycosyltransferase family 2 protein [Eubacteriales bacterium]|nr:glycosyltransferase family 2 protein [Eubacteriales bacterium]
MKVDVIIPTYRPGKEFRSLLTRLTKQSFPVHRILVMNTEESFWEKSWEQDFSILEVHHLKKEDFNHGGTRREAAALSNGDIMVFMTQDAMPKDRNLIENLVRALEQDGVGAAYARQLPAADCHFLERYTRSFNYPEESSVKTQEDLPEKGIKTYFCSNVCAAYKKSVYEEMGGFVERTIFNEDMILAGKMVQNGYGIAYAADARVIHSHNYSAVMQFHRNFDLGVSQAEHPEIFEGVPSEGEGFRLVKKSAAYLCRRGRFWLIPVLAAQSGAKYAGYLCGKHYTILPSFLIRWCSMNKSYWK